MCTLFDGASRISPIFSDVMMGDGVFPEALFFLAGAF
jgi:hypothetical protein